MYVPASVASGPIPARHGNDVGVETLHRAARHGDEHVIKFTDTAELHLIYARAYHR